MRRAIAHIPADALVMPGTTRMRFPASSRGQKSAADLTVWMHADGSFYFQSTTSPDLADLLPRVQAAIAQPRAPSPTTIRLSADRRVAAASIRGLVEGLPPATRYALAVQPADYRAPSPPPVPAWLAEVLDFERVPKEELPARLGDATDRALGSCEAARDAYLAGASSSAEMVEVLVRRLPAGLEACGCGTADVEALTAIVWTMVGDQGPPLGEVPLVLTHDATAESATLSPHATVDDLAALVETRGDHPVRLAP